MALLPSMPLLKPFRGLRPLPHLAGQIIAPPYHALADAEAHTWAGRHELSFVHVTRAEIGLARGTGHPNAAVAAKATRNFERLLARGVLVRDECPCYYAYRITRGTSVRTGITGAASVAAYSGQRIRRHELIQTAKVDDRKRHIEAINAETEPVLLVCPTTSEISALIAAATCAAPDTSVTASDGARHEIWAISDTATVTLLAFAFESLPALYIADGHHRSAAAERLSRAREEAGASAPDAPHRHFLAVVFPEDEVEILDYNRVVGDLGGLEPRAFLAAVAERFLIAAEAAPVRPDQPTEFGMHVAGQWYRLSLKDSVARDGDPSSCLPARLLHDRIVRPILGIDDSGGEGRVAFVSGVEGLAALERSVRERGTGAAFSLCPTRMSELVAVADAGMAMPPKSTWFEPKPADGLVTYLLD